MKEYGGFLPLELSKCTEYKNFLGDSVQRLNCARNAIALAIQHSKADIIYAPYYMCEVVKRAILHTNAKYIPYHIDRFFMPQLDKIEESAYILWCNYFGTQPRTSYDYILKRYKRVIIDNTQAFYARPIPDAYNVYSCRKFFGVSDGAYLTKHGLEIIDFSIAKSSPRAVFLLQSIEEGTNSAYSSYLDSESHLDKEPIGMSKLTHEIMHSINYDQIRTIRIKNFKTLHRLLSPYNILDLSSIEGVPMVYPFLIRKKSLRENLVSQKIYVSQWWAHVLQNDMSNEFEKELSEYLIPLPIDQRYTETDMNEIGLIVKKYVL